MNAKLQTDIEHVNRRATEEYREIRNREIRNRECRLFATFNYTQKEREAKEDPLRYILKYQTDSTRQTVLNDQLDLRVKDTSSLISATETNTKVTYMIQFEGRFGEGKGSLLNSSAQKHAFHSKIVRNKPRHLI